MSQCDFDTAHFYTTRVFFNLLFAGFNKNLGKQNKTMNGYPQGGPLLVINYTWS